MSNVVICFAYISRCLCYNTTTAHITKHGQHSRHAYRRLGKLSKVQEYSLRRVMMTECDMSSYDTLDATCIVKKYNLLTMNS